MFLGWFGGISTDPDRSYHFTKKIFPFAVNLPFKDNNNNNNNNTT